jgi:hypothetical protein
VRDFVGDIEIKSENYFTNRSDEWHSNYKNPHKDAVQSFLGDWHHATLNLSAIGFEATTKKYAELLESLPMKVKA